MEISNQRESEQSKWHKSAGRHQGTIENARQLNAFLDGMVSKIYGYQNEMLQNNIPVSAKRRKNKFSGKEDKSRMLVSIFKQHNSDLEKLVGKEYSLTTLTRYKTSLQHVIKFK